MLPLIPLLCLQHYVLVICIHIMLYFLFLRIFSASSASTINCNRFFPKRQTIPHINTKEIINKGHSVITITKRPFSFYFKNPFTICSSASCSVSPSVISFINCSPAILPIAASWIRLASK